MARNIEDGNNEEFCPNCGQYTEGESTCPNCGAVLGSNGGDGEFDGFHEDSEGNLDEDDI